MGSFSSKPFESLSTAEIQDHVAALGKNYEEYADAVESYGINGKLLAMIKDENDFNSTVLDTLNISDKLARLKLETEWKDAKSKQEKKRKAREMHHSDQVDLTNTELFVPLSDTPLPTIDDDVVPFMAPEGWLRETSDVLVHHMKLPERISKTCPMAFVRCSRGGKTRAMREVTRLVSTESTTVEGEVQLIPTECKPLYVSLNNETPIEAQAYIKSPLAELCDRIGFAARKGTAASLDWFEFRNKYDVSSESIGAWLGSQKCILFIDELNLLPEVSTDVAGFLKEHFLLAEGRCFCLSSHLVTTTKALAGFVPNESDRPIILRTLPLIASLDEARNRLHYPSMSAQRALYFGLIPGLLVEDSKAKEPIQRRAFAVRNTINRMNRLDVRVAQNKFRELMSSFITGSVESVPNELQELMTADVANPNSNEVILQWIPFHMLYALDVMRSQCEFLPPDVTDCLRGIKDNFTQFLNSKKESGDSWEALFLVVVIIRCLSRSFEPDVLPLQNLVGSEQYLVNYNRPWQREPDGLDFNSERNPAKFVAGIPKLNPVSGEDECSVSIYNPGHARFEDYDVIVSVWQGNGRSLYGYQLKEGSNATKGVAHDCVFDASYLIRGRSHKKSSSIRLYRAVSAEQLENFFGVSGAQWTPKRWEALEQAT